MVQKMGDIEAMKNNCCYPKFMILFESKMGHVHCADILHTVILGERLNPGISQEAMMRFIELKGFEKCSLPCGVGSRLVAEFIIDSIIENGVVINEHITETEDFDNPYKPDKTNSFPFTENVGTQEFLIDDFTSNFDEDNLNLEIIEDDIIIDNYLRAPDNDDFDTISPAEIEIIDGNLDSGNNQHYQRDSKKDITEFITTAFSNNKSLDNEWLELSKIIIQSTPSDELSDTSWDYINNSTIVTLIFEYLNKYQKLYKLDFERFNYLKDINENMKIYQSLVLETLLKSNTN